MTKNLKKNLCIILVFSILLSGCGEASISAADAGKAIELFSTDPDGDKKTGSSAYSGSGYKVVFSLSDTWDSGFTANITITNTSPVTLKNWALKFNYRGDLSNVWNAEIKGDKNSGYTAENAGWNKDIEPGKSVEFGMSEQTAFAGFPTEYQLIVDQVSEDIIAATAAPGATDAAGSGDNSISETPSPDQSSDSTSPSDELSEDINTTGETVSGTVKKHGRLRVKGRYIVDKHGKKFLIRGPSTHGIAWFPQYVNKVCFKSFKKWGANTIRLACYSSSGEGYNTDSVWKTIDRGVKAASELGMYVIIDWHILMNGNPKTDMSAAIRFFKHFVKKYRGKKNVLWEICNEPNGCEWANDIKPYAKKLIKVIRKNDKKNIIIVGTPTWSQDVDTAADDRLGKKLSKNVCYTLHFYAATHQDNIRNKVKYAVSKGLPILCTEFSICDASGNGALDKGSGKVWMKLLKKNCIGFISWNISNKAESSSLIKPDCMKTGKLKKKDLTESGKWVIKQWK